MKILQFAFLTALVSVFCGCVNPETQIEEPTPYVDHIVGLASPIHQTFGETEVHLKDYFVNPELIDSVSFQGVALPIKQSKVVLPSIEKDGMTTLKVFLGPVQHDIPVRKSKKERIEFQYKAPSSEVTSVALAGNINGWNPSATPLEKKENGIWTCELILNPGDYAYQVVEDGAWKLDEGNPKQISNGMGGFNNVLTVGTPSSKAKITSIKTENGTLIVETKNDILVFWEDVSLETEKTDAGFFVKIPSQADGLVRSTIRVYAYNESGAGEDLIVPLDNGKIILDSRNLTRHDLQTQIMYFLLVDRFNDGDKSNNLPVEDESILPIANHLGGDIAGITKKIEDGYFEDLGINTIWVSPITQNAEGAWGLWDEGITSKFSGYHGYWPISSTKVDYHFGDETSLTSFIENAHDREMNVLVDYVANHVHENHPVYQEHKDWATPLYLPDGTMNTEKWDEHRLTTWFDTFLPTLDFSNPEVIEAMTDSAMFWFENYDLDGFRHDATKHIPEEFWRTLTEKIKKDIILPENRTIYQIGETYGNPELINSYVSSGQLDAQFDFNLYDAAVDAFAKDQTDFKNLKRVFEEGLEYYGHHHLMGNISGNQDRARFISYADGSVDFAEDPKLAGWTRDIENNGPDGFEKLNLLHAFLLSSPGIPCIYYGDEIGMPGANDPDNRRMMYFDDWNEPQTNVYNNLKTLCHLRSDRMSMLYGSSEILRSDDSIFILRRTYFDETTLIVLCKNPLGAEHTIKESFESLHSSNAILSQDQISFNGRGYIILNKLSE